jgi:3-isopropylmalate/(R)-2-methylmalate dehydratase large subunit
MPKPATGLGPAFALAGRALDVVFVGSCTNSRLSDPRRGGVLRGRKVSARAHAGGARLEQVKKD